MTWLGCIRPDRTGAQEFLGLASAQRQQVDGPRVRRRTPFDRLGADDDVALRHVARECADLFARVGGNFVEAVDDHHQRPGVDKASNETGLLHVMNDARNCDVDTFGAVPRVQEGDRADSSRRDLTQ